MWSSDLAAKMELLSAAQRRAVMMIVTGEAGGVAFSRLLRTTYSCPHCGYVAGRSSQDKEARQAALALHILECSQPETKWTFACNYSTYYGQWAKQKHFVECLAEARGEVVGLALDEAARILQFGTTEAAQELVRQIRAGEKDFDKRDAAKAVLDRATTKTAAKVNDSMARWLAALRGEDNGEMADPGTEVRDLSAGGLQPEPDSD